MSRTSWRAALCALAVLAGGGVAISTAPVSGAVCGSIGGRHVDVSGCSDPLWEMNYATRHHHHLRRHRRLVLHPRRRRRSMCRRRHRMSMYAPVSAAG
jgi:hypothetical protein